MCCNILQENMVPVSGQDLVQKHRHTLLKSVLFSGLTPRLQGKLMDVGRVQKWQRGELLFMDGSRVDCFHYIISGKVKEYYYNGGGEEFLRRVGYPGSYISLHNLLRQDDHHTYTCEAMKSTESITWSAGQFIPLLKRSPQLGIQVAGILAQNYERVCRRNCLCKKKHVGPRVAGYLLSKLNSECNHIPCICSINGCCQVDLRPLSIAAEDICMARETLTRVLAQFERDGNITHYRGVVTILNEKALKVVSGVE